jgi:two-component system sensor histidine kinase CpxA
MKLFTKLFITLGLAITVAMVAAVTLGFYIGQLQFQQWLRFDDNREAIINQAFVAVNSGGREGLTTWLRQNETPLPGYTVYIVDDRNEDLLGRQIPPEARFLLEPYIPRSTDRTDEQDGNDGARSGRRFDENNRRFDNQRFSPNGATQNRFSARLVEEMSALDGQRFRLLVRATPITVLEILNLPATRVGVVTLAVIMAAATALLFAKSLSSPIVRLQRATRALAAGALDTRVGRPFVDRKDEVGTLARDFDTMAEQIQALITDKEVLLRDVSHELRSPLARIRVALALAQRKADVAAVGDLARIEQETEKLDQLVGQILALARLRSSPLEQLVDVNLDELLREVVENARFEHPDQAISYTAGVVPTIPGDAAELSSAVENVLRNALLHAGPTARVAVELGQSGSEVIITVSDNGPGVPEDQLARLFEPFYRVDPSRDHKKSGYGLGLAIASSVIQRHGGSITARNRPEGGLAVTFHLPSRRPV